MHCEGTSARSTGPSHDAGASSSFLVDVESASGVVVPADEQPEVDEFVVTTARLGAHVVPGVVMSHRRFAEVEPAVVAWLSVPVSLTVDEVAAVFYGLLEPHEPATTSPGAARQWVAELVGESGTSALERAVQRVDELQAADQLCDTHWQGCVRLARAVVTPPVPPSPTWPGANLALAPRLVSALDRTRTRETPSASRAGVFGEVA